MSSDAAVPAPPHTAVGAGVVIDPEAVNADSVTPVAPPLESAPRFSDVLRAGLITGVTAAILCSLLWLVGWIFRAEFRVPFGGGDTTMLITPIQITIVAMISALGFALIATALRARKRCRMYVLVLGYLGGLLSLVPVFAMPDTVTWPTKIWLAIMHVVVTLVVVPQVARVVGDSDPRATAGYRRTGLEAA